MQVAPSNIEDVNRPAANELVPLSPVHRLQSELHSFVHCVVSTVAPAPHWTHCFCVQLDTWLPERAVPLKHEQSDDVFTADVTFE